MELASDHEFAAGAAIAGRSTASAQITQGQRRVRARLLADPWPAALLLVAITPPLGLAAGHDWLNLGVETDFLGLFVPEAKRLLAGRPLLIAFHLPLYPAALALARSLLGDWVRAGIAVSLLTATASALTTWWLIDRLFGRNAALGALAALASSAPYLAQAPAASSDLFFLALYLGACAVAVAGLRKGSDATWLGLGLIVGLALLTRTNALPLVLLLLAPFLRPDAAARRARGAALAFAALALPLSLWLEFAAATGSPPWPTSNHVNLAMTYFATGAQPVSNEAFVSVAGRFHNVLEVLAYDPARMLATYLADLLRLGRDRLPGMIAFPLGLLALPGMLLLRPRRCAASAGLLGLVTLGEILLVNFKTFEARYWLFLVPWLGAGLGAMLAEIHRALPASRAWRRGQAIVLGGSGPLALALAFNAARAELSFGAQELAEAVPAARALAGPGDLLVARKPHLAYYTGARFVLLPDLKDAAALSAWLCGLRTDGQVLVYDGQMERTFRPALQPVLGADPPPPWLERVAGGADGGWTLQRRRNAGCMARAPGAGGDAEPTRVTARPVRGSEPSERGAIPAPHVWPDRLRSRSSNAGTPRTRRSAQLR
jgi:4-amino-4-deoxy-L-arabinose transferase-like glycosyltransferase